MSREDLSLITVTIRPTPTAAVINLGTFDKKSGGKVQANSTKYRSGGKPTADSLGGPSETENVMFSRNWKPGRDGPLMPMLYQAVGRGQLVVTEQPLDENYAATGQPTVYRGTLVAATPPDRDSESSDAAMLELELEPSGLPS